MLSMYLIIDEMICTASTGVWRRWWAGRVGSGSSPSSQAVVISLHSRRIHAFSVHPTQLYRFLRPMFLQ